MAAMMASLLSPPPTDAPARISQLLPTVKCSDCNNPIPLAELGEHTCSAPPPLPKIPPQVPTLPKPSVTPAAATALLPQRLQNRVVSPVSSNGPSIPPPRPGSANDRYQPRSSPLARPNPERIDTSSPSSSVIPPVGRNFSPVNSNSISASSPLRPTGDFRARAMSNVASAAAAGPSAPRPSFSSAREVNAPPRSTSVSTPGPSRGGPPMSNMGPPSPIGPPLRSMSGPSPTSMSGPAPSSMGPSSSMGHFPQSSMPLNMNPNNPPPRMGPPTRQMSYVPPPERDIDTKVGGQAGMAGVGRRGFAAAARAAMFVPMASQQQGMGGMRRQNAPVYLDINAASRTTGTPPLSAGSGYSSHSPGPLSPLPQTEYLPPPSSSASSISSSMMGRQPQSQSPRTPSPPRGLSPGVGMTPGGKTPTGETPSTPTLGVRMPFFEKFKNILPGASNNNSPTSDIPPTSATTPNAATANDIPYPRDANSTPIPHSVTPTPDSLREIKKQSTVSHKTTSSFSSYTSGSTSSFYGNREREGVPREGGLRESKLDGGDRESKIGGRIGEEDDSGSEYGLAYADSTDYEDDDEDVGGLKARLVGLEEEVGGNEKEAKRASRRVSRKVNLPPPLALGLEKEKEKKGILQKSTSVSTTSSSSYSGLAYGKSQTDAESTTSTNRVRFPSLSDQSAGSADDDDERAGIRIGKRPGHRKGEDSTTSFESAGSAERVRVESNTSRGRAESNASRGVDIPITKGQLVRNNSAQIAHALGLSQTPPSEYAKLGGPGMGGGRGGRSGRGGMSERSGSVSSVGSGGAVSARRVDAGGMGMDTVLEGPGLVKSKSTGKQRSFGSGSASGSVRRLELDSEKTSTIGADLEKEPLTGKSVKFSAATTGGAGSSGAKTQRSNTVQGLHSPESSKHPKLPTRSKTERDSVSAAARKRDMNASGSGVSKVKKQRVCVRCEKRIEDGRWVQMDGGGVLCEKCWKNMYLPKCRRCSLPIERQAVSSSDGQLKGKYHKECFNCHTCHKPFPDKTFYVYDGKPLCAYHYHEANDSLCAAARCGQPIEGPCAVSHTGDRYHPEHMTCEYPGYPECRERLNEYWEVDGRMLCERHAHATAGEEDDWAPSAKAQKRITRFIDLAGAGVVGAGGGAGREEEDSGLR
ncbi:hypothetical protein BDQ12DRAFT_269471 [Crucibulum laeve]|uniref:LIM zinc-binding domain-containing protein n=1 Tax=Crucibulum laeve TaxID=68775 RepID=A0A5C3MC45_9AGAR|nr:hypothetical protein BDQ12DRAFT_269471 [Crucibulum laeve]